MFTCLLEDPFFFFIPHTINHNWSLFLVVGIQKYSLWVFIGDNHSRAITVMFSRGVCCGYHKLRSYSLVSPIFVNTYYWNNPQLKNHSLHYIREALKKNQKVKNKIKNLLSPMWMFIDIRSSVLSFIHVWEHRYSITSKNCKLCALLNL